MRPYFWYSDANLSPRRHGVRMETSFCTTTTWRAGLRKTVPTEFLRRILLILSVAMCVGSSAAWADSVTVNTSISLTGLGLQISPDSGTLVFLSSPVPTTTFAQALDSTGGSASQSDPTSSSATTGLADASGTASATALTGTATANINLPDFFIGQASSTGQANLGQDPTFTMFGVFQINSAGGTPSSVNVTFSAPLAIDQFLQTSGFGQFASSEAIFTLMSPDINSGSPILAYDNLLTIGPGQTLSNVTSPTLTTTQSLLSDTPYNFTASLDAESSGVSDVPEPSSLPLVLIAVGFSAVLGRRLTRKPRPDGRA
jgi:hypothetical protein